MSMAEQISEMEAVVVSLMEIQDDATVPRNVRTQVQSTISTLKTDTELSIKVSKALSGLSEIVNDVNLQPYTRTQIYNVMTTLEKLH